MYILFFIVPAIFLVIAIHFLIKWVQEHDGRWVWAMLFFTLTVISASVAIYYKFKIEIQIGVTKTEHFFFEEANAIEAFYADHGKYPPHQIRNDGSPTLETILKPENGNMILTTPIDYKSYNGGDMFFYDKSRIDIDPWEQVVLDYQFAYRCDPEGGWILGSRGPDNDWDIDYIRAYDISKGEDACPGDPDFLIPWTYDPSNGLRSSGDIWRVRQ